MGLNDDWSYTFIARGVARSGRIVYNGWSAPMLGFQVLWAGLLIRLFGFSFTLVRLSTLPFAAGSAGLLFGLARRAGLDHALATFSSLAITLSPVFIPLATSYMTDVPALFFWLATFYCALRAAESDCAHPVLWLAGAAATGFAGGSIRQVVWIAPVLCLPAAAWFLRRQPWVLVSAALLWCGVLAGAFALLRWNAAQPGHPAAPFAPLADELMGLPEATRLALLGTLVAMLPVLLVFLARWRRWIRAPLTPVLASLGIAAYVLACLWYFSDDLLLGNIVTPVGILWVDNELLGDKPTAVPASVRAVVAALLCIAAGCAIAWILDAWRNRRQSEWPARGRLARFLAITLPSTALYAGALTLRYANDEIMFDRYLILLTPVPVIALLWLFQARIALRPPVAAWMALGILAVFGIAITHDYIAAARARLRAANSVIASGVPRVRVSAGFEVDGWTQLELAGEVPPLAERQHSTRTYSIPEPYWFWPMTPVIDPLYVVVYNPVEDLQPSGFAPVPYRTWLPPFQRRLLIQKMP